VGTPRILTLANLPDELKILGDVLCFEMELLSVLRWDFREDF